MPKNKKKKNISVALYQPDIPQNTGSIIRLTACFGVSLHIIEPAGFIIDDKRLNRVAMDYINHLDIIKHPSWNEFLRWSKSNSYRIILATTKTERSYLDINYAVNDILLFGRESSGVPEEVHNQSDTRVKIEMQKGMRSFNVSSSCAIILGEAVRQISDS